MGIYKSVSEFDVSPYIIPNLKKGNSINEKINPLKTEFEKRYNTQFDEIKLTELSSTELADYKINDMTIMKDGSYFIFGEEYYKMIEADGEIREIEKLLKK